MNSASRLRAVAGLPLLAFTIAASGQPGKGGGSGGGGGTPPPDPVIAFVDSGISVMNADGSNARRLVAARGSDLANSPAWSHDGTQIYFWGRYGGTEGVYRVPVAGGSSMLITPTLNISSARPDCSPVPAADGEYKIAFIDRDAQSGRLDVFLMNTDGSGRTNLTMTQDITDASVGWAPDGRRLIVERFEQMGLAVLEVDLVNGALTVVNETIVYPVHGSGPRWANTTEAITFAANSGIYRIVALDLSAPSSGPVQLTYGPSSDDTWPCFSPDDSKIVFFRYGTGGGIFTANLDGSGETCISSKGRQPAWRRD